MFRLTENEAPEIEARSPWAPDQRCFCATLRALTAFSLAGAWWLIASADLQAQKPRGKVVEQLARAEALIAEEDPGAARIILDEVLARGSKDGRPYLLRSTARFMLNDLEGGASDLERALALDPALRQGWLNLGALRFSEERFEDALDAFLRAETLDPAADDNDLNLGTALLLLGRVAEARDRFTRYLETRSTGEDHYLVAKNYALAGYQAPAIEQLERAIELDERLRLRARTDPTFLPLQASTAFLALLERRMHRPVPGSYVAQRTYEQPYDPQGGVLLGAVLEAMRQTKVPIDPRVEVTESWAVIWSTVRVEVARSPDNEATGVVSLTAPPGAFTPQEWQNLSERLLNAVAVQLRTRAPSKPPPSTEARHDARF